jgi:hypothetical protein
MEELCQNRVYFMDVPAYMEKGHNSGTIKQISMKFETDLYRYGHC